MNKQIDNLRERVGGLLKRLKTERLDVHEQKSIESLPPYNQYVAYLRSRLKFQRISYIMFCLFLVAVIGRVEYDKYLLNQKLERREVFFVPTHIPNILKLRANTLSDSLVFEFSDWFITQLGNINFDMVEEKFGTLTKYMSPELRTRFLREMRPKADLWKMRRVDQTIFHEKVKRFERKTNGRSTDFVVSTWTNIRKYVDGREQPPEREHITITFRTSPVDSEKSWLFEVVDLVRKTPQEIEDEKILNEEGKK
jgi:hypothetical protein